MPSRKGALVDPGALWTAVIAVVVVLVVTVRRRWRRAAERAEEVRRLLERAAEESAWAEWEAQATWTYGCRPAVAAAEGRGEVGGGKAVAGAKHCAVCHSQTSTRCSRCKAVWYCSGRCQIIHWRQGHKDACQPPDDTNLVTPENGRVLDCVDAIVSGSTECISDSFSTKLTGALAGRCASFESFSSGIFSEDQKVNNILAGEDSCSIPSNSSSGSCTPIHNGWASRNIDNTKHTLVEDRKSFSDDFSTIKSGETVNSSSDSSTQLPFGVPASAFLGQPSHSHKPSTRLGCESLSMRNSFSGECKDASSEISSDCEAVSDVISLKSSSVLANSILIKPQKKEQLENKLPQISSNNSVKAFSSQQVSATISTSYKGEDSLVSNDDNSDRVEYLPRYKASKPLPDSLSSAAGGIVSGGFLSTSLSVSAQPGKPVGKPSISVISGSGIKSSVRKASQQLRQSKPSNSGMVLFPYELFVKLYNEKMELRPCGFANLGNSCYANVVLQCLVFTRPLAAYLLQGLHKRTCQKKDWCFICEFEGLLVEVKQGRSSLSPTGMLSQIHNIGSHLIHGKEEDAHEFLRYAIDAMQRVCLEEPGANELGKIAEETSLIQLTFGGYLLSKIKCLKCHVKSERCERMMDLTVEIHGDIGNLDDALHQFTRTELLDGENKYRCDSCNSFERAKKKLTVAEAPNILTIVLKRFQSGKFGKINKAVKFSEYLNLEPYMSNPSDKGPVYVLYAVVVHVDIMNSSFSGHYVCYVKDFHGRWFKADDSSVKPVDFERVRSKSAYMLLYSRCSPRAPSLMRDMRAKASEKMKSKSFNGADSGVSGSNPSSWSSSSHGWDGLNLFDRCRGRSFPACQDSSSDCSSLLSCSDEVSCSTESARDSTSMDGYSDNLSPCRFSFDSDCSGSPSLNDHISELHRCESSTPPDSDHPSRVGSRNPRKVNYSIAGGGPSILSLDKIMHCSQLTEQCSSGRANTCDTRPSSLTRRPARDRTAQASL